EGPADRGLYAQNRWAALRFGHQADLVHPEESRLVSVPDLLQELVARLGSEPVEVPDQALEQLQTGRGSGLDSLSRRLGEPTEDPSVPLQTHTIHVTAARPEAAC